ncbi:MAG: MlaD family protein [Myxococcales bacterium]|nr:MlaD family protein [Myxococcales bacterium]MDD9966821.1 MlaD family protein [Myxococcales bacterium]
MSARRNFRVLVFLAVGLFALGSAVFLIGQKSGLFDAKATLYVKFPDVQGLVVGAPVRLAGLDIGMVADIEFSPGLDEIEARVTMSITAEHLPRIREDSRAKIDSKGLLGDKLIEISVGSPNKPGLEDGETVQTEAATSLAALATSLEEAVSSVTRAADTADQAVARLASERTQEDFSRILSSLASIVEAVERGDGLAHRLVYDRSLADRVALAADHAGRALAAAHRATERMDRILTTIESGPGAVHALVYGQELQQAVSDVASASATLKQLVGDVRTEPGLLHGLIYGESDSNMLSDLASAAARLDRLMAAVERGEGTVGGLMVDPTVYEDMKTILGNVERNVLLKALIRFAIKEGDIERPARMPEAKAAP